MEKDNFRILVVDDEVGILEFVSRVLRNAGFFGISTAKNGNEGLEMFKSSRDFGLVITDVAMPCMDGIVMAENISKKFNGNSPPVVFISGKDYAGKIAQAGLPNVKGFFLKPLTPLADFIGKIQEISEAV